MVQEEPFLSLWNQLFSQIDNYLSQINRKNKHLRRSQTIQKSATFHPLILQALRCKLRLALEYSLK